MKLQWISLSTLVVAGVLLEGTASGGEAGLLPFDGSGRGRDDARRRHARGGDKRSRRRETGGVDCPFRRCPGTQAGVQFRPGGRSRAVDRLSPMSGVPQRGGDRGKRPFADPNRAAQSVRGLDSPPLPRQPEAAQEATGLVADKRARHFRDGGGSLGKEYGKIISLPQNKKFAWDVYLVFGRQAKWTKCAPKPDFWMHQLGGPETGNMLDGEKFRQDRRQTCLSGWPSEDTIEMPILPNDLGASVKAMRPVVPARDFELGDGFMLISDFNQKS